MPFTDDDLQQLKDDLNNPQASMFFTEDMARRLIARLEDQERLNDLNAAEQAKKEVELREQVRKEAMRFAFKEVTKLVLEWATLGPDNGILYRLAAQISIKEKEIT
jgi:DNA-binding MltR family transcriptional regulator